MKIFARSLQITLVATCMVWLLLHVEWGVMVERCAQVSSSMLFIVFCQRYAPYVMLGLRLSQIFPQRVSAGDGFKASLLCVGCNNILPARMGELVKIVWLRGKNNLAYHDLFCGVFLERLLDVSALLLLVLLFAASYGNTLYILNFTFLVFALWVFVIFVARYPQAVQCCLVRFPLPRCMHKWVEMFFQIFTTKLKLWPFVSTLGVTFLVWAMNYLHVGLLANGLMNLNLSWQGVGLLCVTMFFSGALLLVPGGIGVMELAVVTMLTLMGTSREEAIATAFFARLFYSVPPLLGSACVLLWEREGPVTVVQKIYADVCTLRNTKHTAPGSSFDVSSK